MIPNSGWTCKFNNRGFWVKVVPCVCYVEEVIIMNTRCFLTFILNTRPESGFALIWYLLTFLPKYINCQEMEILFHPLIEIESWRKVVFEAAHLCLRIG